MKRILVVGVDAPDARSDDSEILFRAWEDYGPIRRIVDGNDDAAASPRARTQKDFVHLNDVDGAVLLLEGGPSNDGVHRTVEAGLRGLDLNAISDLMRIGFSLVVVGGPFGPGLPNSVFTSVGIEYEWARSYGESVSPTDKGKFLSRFFSEVRRYRWAAGELAWNADRMPPDTSGLSPRVWGFERTVLAEARHGQPVAAAYRTTSFSLSDRTGTKADIKRHGILYFLPPSTLPVEVTAEILLEDLFGVRFESTPPAWVDTISVPGQREIDQQIDDVEQEIARLTATKTNLEAARARLREPLRLLFESERALEPVVWDALETVGATVERPQSHVNAEDGWIAVEVDGQILRGVLEIKSAQKSTLPEKPIRQAVDWREKSIQERGLEYKAIVVGTADVMTVPEERGDPFGHSFRQNAKRNRVAVVRCEDLYKALVLHACGKLDQQGFFREVFATEGVVDFGEILSDT